MGETNSSTLERIHAAAQAEFLEKGYQGASLRNIVKTAGVTTGALYGYYDSKERCSPHWWTSPTATCWTPTGPPCSASRRCVPRSRWPRWVTWARTACGSC